MITCPPDVEIATPHDVPALHQLLRLRHQEEGQGGFDDGMALDLLCRGVMRWGGAVVGVIRGKHRVEASVGLFPDRRHWCSPDLHIIDLWNYVAPPCRRSTHARNLFVFAKWVASTAGAPLMMRALEDPTTTERVKLYGRQMQRAGVIFIFDPTVATAVISP